MMRLLTSADVPATMELSTAAGWNQTPQDWERIIRFEPRGCFGIEADGKLVATTTLLCYGSDLAWVGMVLTHADHQRRGYARKLVSAAVDEARGRGIACIKLDATDEGRPLYSSLGFVDEQPIERWRGIPRVDQQPPKQIATDLFPAELDREAFGTDRTGWLRALGSPVQAGPDGYVMARPGSRARYLGPCISSNPAHAQQSIGSVLTAEPWFWDVLPANTAALAMVQSFGFEPVRRLSRMRLGKPVETREDLVFAIAGFEAG